MSAPLGYLSGSASASADLLQTMAWGFSAVSALVVAVIVGLIWVAIARGRRRAADGDPAALEKGERGLTLIWWGVGLSLPVLVALALWTMSAARELATPPTSQPFTITITAHRWWWQTDTTDGRGPPFAGANEIVIPTGRPVALLLASADVIHDFWVPKLGPKMDMIPGRTNRTWLEARTPGTYRGQCAEFCGFEHARMAFTVRALAPGDYARWSAGQRTNPNQAGTSPGSALFVERCGTCHTVRGTGAGGIMGPDLTHLAGRSTIAAGLAPNTPDWLSRWIADPQALKPGTEMPQVPLTAAERQQLVAYLGTLR